MIRFPPAIPARRRFLLGCAGVLSVLLLWWAVTLPVFRERIVRSELVGTGTFDVLKDPVSGGDVRVERTRRVEREEERPRALVNPPALDTPRNTARDAWRLIVEGRPGLLAHTLWSTGRILAGFLLAAAVAVPLGVAMGLFPSLRALLSPLISFLRPLPSISWVPLAMIWLGADEAQKLAIIFMGCFSAAVVYTVEATLKVDPVLIRAARNLGATPRQLLWRVLLPAALPNVVSGLKVVLAIGWTCVISAEIVGTQKGLGALIWTSKETSNTAAVLVGMATISGVVLLLDVAAERIERALLPWVSAGDGR